MRGPCWPWVADLTSQNCRNIVITSLPTFQHRFGSRTTVRYHADTVAASEPHAVDIVSTGQDPRDVELRTQRHLVLLRVRIKKGQLAMSPSFAKKVPKFMATDHNIRAIKERLTAKRKRPRLRKKALLQKAQDAKTLAATRKRLQEDKARHRVKAAAAKRNKSEVGSGSNGSSRAAGPSVKKQKTGATEVRAIPTNKGKGKAVSVEEGSDNEFSGFPDFDDDVYQQMDAAATAEIEKRLRVQQEWKKEQHISEETVDIKAFILSLPLKDFRWDRVVVDEAQVLRNISSGYSRYIRLLMPYSRALHMLSATLTLNSINDIRSLASLA